MTLETNFDLYNQIYYNISTSVNCLNFFNIIKRFNIRKILVECMHGIYDEYFRNKLNVFYPLMS